VRECVAEDCYITAMDGFIRIAVVGAPGSGKTTGVPVLKAHVKALGYEVRAVPEAATTVLRLMKPTDPRALGLAGVKELQRAVYRLQIAMEDAVLVGPARSRKGCVVICDRGVMDGEVYLGQKAWKGLLKEEGAKYAGLLKRYDVVIHLGTAAGLEGVHRAAYRAEGVRREDGAFALELEERAREIWSRHPGYVFVAASEELEAKWDVMRGAVNEAIKP
jgi:thymidylate kinase